MGRLIKPLTRVFNPLAARLAALGVFPIWGLVRHTGRRSGRTFTTPIAITATAGGFYIPLPWGPGTDWCRNIIAAGGGRVRYRGREHPVGDPKIVSRAEAGPAFPAILRPIIPVVGIREFLWLRRLEERTA